jgi:hypothetical protein
MSQKKLQRIYEKILLENSEGFPKTFPSGKAFLSNISPQSLGYRLGQYMHDKLKDKTGFDYRKKVLGKDQEIDKTNSTKAKEPTDSTKAKEPTKIDYKVIPSKVSLDGLYKNSVVDSANLIRLGIPEETLNNLKNFTLKGVTITDGTEYVVINFKYGRFVVVASSLIKPKTP